MPKQLRMHAGSPGYKQSRNGQQVMLMNSDLDELAQSYRPDLHQCKVAVDDVTTAVMLGAPAVLGHLDPKLVQAKGAMPAFGRILSASTEADGLWLDVELTDAMAQYMADGLYDHVSLSWYERGDSRNPTPGKLHMRHLGILGAEPSAMKDLQLPDTSQLLEFSESTDDTGNVYHVVQLTTQLEFAEPNMDPSVTDATTAPADEEQQEVTDETVDPVQMLIQTLTSGAKGYKGEITGFNPEATADNGYLWDADKQQFAGQFLDDSGNEEEVYDFTLSLEPDGTMIRSYKRVIADDEAEAEPTDEVIEAEADVADDAAVEMGEGCGTKPKEMSEGYREVEIGSELQPSQLMAPNTITIDADEYEALKAKSLLYAEMLEAEANRRRTEQLTKLQDALMPLYDMGLISPMVQPDSVARALMSMSESASGYCCDEDESYELEFSEGEVHTSPMQTVIAVFDQIGANAKIMKDTEIEFGEMELPETEEEPETNGSAKLPAGVMANPAQAELDKKARKYCKDNGLDCKDSKQYLKAIKAVS